MQHDPRRTSPRIGIEALCWEVIGERELSSLVVDLSTEGARLERPFVGGRLERVVPLQIEVPGIDEVMWARGEVVFDTLVPAPANAGPFGLIRRTGYHISLAAARDLRLLGDYVWDMHARLRASAPYEAADRPEPVIDFQFASCYMRG